MRIEVRASPLQQTQRKTQRFLTAEMILRYLIGSDDQMDTLIMCTPNETELVTTDQQLYEAIGSTKQEDNIKLNKLTKLLEGVQIFPQKQAQNRERSILKEERVEEVRKAALSK